MSGRIRGDLGGGAPVEVSDVGADMIKHGFGSHMETAIRKITPYLGVGITIDGIRGWGYSSAHQRRSVNQGAGSLKWGMSAQHSFAMIADVAIYIAIATIAYVLGAFPTAYVVVRRLTGANIIEQGTGNVGTMNTHRATGSKALTLLVLAGDTGKGAAALCAGYGLAQAGGSDVEIGPAVGGISAVVGHNYSVFLRLKGGKGLATSAPLLLWFAPLLAPIWIGAFFLVVGVTRLMVLGQIAATLLMPPLAHVLHPEGAWAIDIAAALVFVRHAPRLRHVWRGTEPKLYYKARTPEGG